MMRINVVSKVPASQWQRELASDLALDFVHTRYPVPADIHAIYGLRERLVVPNSPRNVLFIACEPPEIRPYNLDVLSQYGTVLGPSFDYLRSLPNYSFMSSVAPWWVGLSSGSTSEYEPVNATPNLSRLDFKNGFRPKEDRISAVLSEKSGTPLQEQRLRLADYLAQHLENFDIHGGPSSRVEDKAEVLMRSRYHLAIENSTHQGYWTEKIADPILMDNVVFYGGDAGTLSIFKGSVSLINPFEMEETYRLIATAIEKGLWDRSAEYRANNRLLILDKHNFHHSLANVIQSHPGGGSAQRQTIFPRQHRRKSLRRVFDPIYRRLRARA